MIASLLLLSQTSTTLTIDLAQPGVRVSPTLYGLMTEEINHSYDGGLYAELVRNRTFQDNDKEAVHWKPAGPSDSISLEQVDGINSARPVALKVSGGVANEGYWGYPVRPNTVYQLTLWAKVDKSGDLAASLESLDGKSVFAKADVTGLSSAWKKVSVRLKTGSVKPTKDARLVLRTTGGQTAWFNMVSLFPPTFKNRPNGNRPDLMKMMIDMKPKFLRFPGGNYLEGSTFPDRFDWKRTIGPIEERPGHRAPWGYRSSDGMGLLEFLEWTEDMGAEPVLGVFAGYTLNGDVVKAGPELDQYVMEALEEIEYCVGGPETKWGARRIADGHPKPFPLRYVEIGNEDGFDKSKSYEGRFVQFFDAIKKKYPQIQVISSTGGRDWLGAQVPITERKPDALDEHYYSSLWDMMAMAGKYDSYDRSGPKVFVGEYAAHDGKAPWEAGASAGPTPDYACAIAEAAFLTGVERNSDVVHLLCYAPLLVNVNPGAHQWALNMVGYDAMGWYGSPSYYLQVMFANNLGDQTVSTRLTGVPDQKDGDRTLPGIFASSTRDSKTGMLFIKVVNALSMPQSVQFQVKGGAIGSTATRIQMSGDPKALNSLEKPKNVSPRAAKVSGLSHSFVQTMPAHSITVYRMTTD